MAFSNADAVTALIEKQAAPADGDAPMRSVEVIMGKKARRVYDSPDKGILWGWEVSAYVWTKAISAGVFLVLFLATIFGLAQPSPATQIWTYGLGLTFLAITGLLLIKDLDQPWRFAYVMLRPHWGSWLVKGSYAISAYGGLLTLLAICWFFDLEAIGKIGFWATGAAGLVVAIYTAFLFGQCKGRDFWQSPALAVHMLVHSFMAGAATLALVAMVSAASGEWMHYLRLVLLVGIGVNLLTMFIELTAVHPTVDSHRVAKMITKGRYAKTFYLGILLLGNLVPLGLLLFVSASPILAVAAVAVLIGIYFTEHVWVEAPQRIELS